MLYLSFLLSAIEGETILWVNLFSVTRSTFPLENVFTSKMTSISPSTKQGPSPYHILLNHSEWNMSVRTMHFYLQQRLFTARNIELKRANALNQGYTAELRSWIERFPSTDFIALLIFSKYAELNTVHSLLEEKETLMAIFKKLFFALLINWYTEDAASPVFDWQAKLMELPNLFLCLNISR